MIGLIGSYLDAFQVIQVFDSLLLTNILALFKLNFETTTQVTQDCTVFYGSYLEP